MAIPRVFWQQPIFVVALLGLGFILAALGCSIEDAPVRCTFDIPAIEKADQAYAAAWLTNDSAQVMATLTEDAVIMPSGLPALRGTSEIRSFWWPVDSPPTMVTEFDLVQQEVGGTGRFAFVRGSFMLKFQMGGDSYSRIGDYLSLMQCLPEGTWRISHRLWNDHPQPSD